MNKYFRKLGNKSPRVQTQKFGIIDLRSITPERAFDVWKAGFKDIGITPEGAKKYLSKINAPELSKLIRSRTDLDDVLILSKLNKAAAVKKAKEEMIAKLCPEEDLQKAKEPDTKKESEKSGS